MQITPSDLDQEPCHAESKTAEADEMKIDLSQNNVICGDNAEWLEWLPNDSVDLCYIDPPFFSDRKYEVIWGNGAELRSFEDRWQGDVYLYVQWMKTRIEKVYWKLKPTGSIFLQCDHRASHYLRVMLDQVFGKQNFLNEIVWLYRQGGRSENYFPRKHGTIYWYAKGKDWVFNDEPVRIPYHGTGGYQTSGKGVTNKKSGKVYKPNPAGKIIEDWWDIPALAPMDKERIGYPTQKPEALVERIISVASNPGDVVLDCFSGGGTTAKVCANLGRKFIVGDVSPVAVRVTSERLMRAGVGGFSVKGFPSTIEAYQQMDATSFERLICDVQGWQHSGKPGDGNIDGWDANQNPVQIKNRIAATGPKDIREFEHTIRQAKKTRGSFVSWEYTSGARELVSKLELEDHLKIELIEARTILQPFLYSAQHISDLETLYTERVPEEWKDPLQKVS